nr:MAG TPA: hypothetical protein [Caudoviricetes sp.]
MIYRFFSYLCRRYSGKKKAFFDIIKNFNFSLNIINFLLTI